MMLPDLARLDLRTARRGPGATGKSWSWSPGAYKVVFSIDTAIEEQIDGVEAALEAFARDRDALRHSDGNLTGSLPKTQLSPLELLRTLLEYTVQRLWDHDCAMPATIVPPPNENWSGRTTPGTDGELLAIVARCLVGIANTALPRGDVYEEEEEEEDDAEGEGDGQEAIEAQYAALCSTLRTSRAEHQATRGRLQRTLVDVAAAIEEAERASQNLDELDARAEAAASAIVENREAWTTPKLRSVRRLPPPNYYRPRRRRSAKYIRWIKTHLLIYRKEIVNDVPFAPDIDVPWTLDGSFYSGKLRRSANGRASFEARLKALHYDHVVPISHFRTALLVREFGDVLHLAWNSVFAFSSENGAKGNRFLPLTLSDETWQSMAKGESNPVYTPDSLRAFEPERRIFAARSVCATYLSTCLLERGADGHTEMGQRRGGFYAEPSRSKEAFQMATNARQNSSRANRKAALAFERALALVQWVYLAQPFNPMAEMAFRADAQTNGDARALDPTWFYYEQLLYARFSSVDTLSELMRRETREEVAFAPGAAEALATVEERRAARERLESVAPSRGQKRKGPVSQSQQGQSSRVKVTTRDAVASKRAPPIAPELRSDGVNYWEYS